MNINEIMSIDVKTCKPNSNLEDVAGLMWTNDCGAIPIVDDNNKPLGVITDRDIAMAAMLNHKPLWSLTPDELIREQELCCCQQNDSLQDCLNKMKEYGVRRILVTNADGTLAGIVSIGDILAFTGNSRPKGSKAAPQVKMQSVIEMLSRVSAHHMQPEKPLVETKSSREATAI